MSRRAVAACLIRTAQGWLKRASAFRCLPRGDGSPAPVHTHPRGKDLLQPRVLWWMRFLLQALTGWDPQLANSRFVRQSLRFSTHPLLVNHLATEKICGAAGSEQCLEDGGQGGQAASVPGWQTAQSLVYQWNNSHWFMSRVSWGLLTGLQTWA